MRRALIGHTGFVGSNLRAQGSYTDLFNSANFRDLAGQSFDEVTCAGISAVKWLANKEPEKDWAAIHELLDVLETMRVRRFVLISTIDVYPQPEQPFDESANLDGMANHAYGRHRLAVEQWVAERFRERAIVRLPALFGPYLKKNALFDLLNDNNVRSINPGGCFQWYPVRRLGGDLEIVARTGIDLVNLFPEPVAMAAIIAEFFPSAAVGPMTTPASVYRLKTRHAKLFGGDDGYVMDARAVLDAMGAYVSSARSQAGANVAGQGSHG